LKSEIEVVATHTDTDFLRNCPINCPTPPAFKVKDKDLTPFPFKAVSSEAKPFRKEFQSSKRSSNAPGVTILIP
jgi:hypothetical protein